jgi:Ca-activated chloride channel family protein
LVIKYGFSSEEVMANLIKSENQENSNGAFALFVTPPTTSGIKGYFKRNLIFLLDKSGSMTGEPYKEATRSLLSALDTLHSTDKFSIVVFDHQQIVFSEFLVEASSSNIGKAKNWIEGHQPQGGGTGMIIDFL